MINDSIALTARLEHRVGTNQPAGSRYTAPKANIYLRWRCYGYHPLVPFGSRPGTSVKRGSPELGGRAAEAPPQRRLRSEVCCCRSTQSSPSRTNTMPTCSGFHGTARPQRTLAASSLPLGEACRQYAPGRAADHALLCARQVDVHLSDTPKHLPEAPARTAAACRAFSLFIATECVKVPITSASLGLAGATS